MLVALLRIRPKGGGWRKAGKHGPEIVRPAVAVGELSGRVPKGFRKVCGRVAVGDVQAYLLRLPFHQ